MTLPVVKIITADGRRVSVGGGSSLASVALPQDSIRLAKRRNGTRPAMRYAEVARANPWVRAAVNARASVASRVPLHVFRAAEDDKGRRYADRVRPDGGGDGAVLARLMEVPGAGVSSRRLKRRLLHDLLVHGNALLEEVTVRGALAELAWQPWVDVVPHPSEDKLRQEAFEVPVERRDALWRPGRLVRGQTRMIDRDQAVHFVVEDELTVAYGPVGVSPLAALHYTHALHDAAMRFAVNYLDQGIFPTGVVELQNGATAAMAQATTELLEAIHSTVENVGKPLAVPGKWHQVSATPEAAKLLELARWSREEVAAAYGLTLQQLGDLGNSNRATAVVGRESFVRDVIGDDVNVLESEFNAQLIPRHRRWAAAGLWVEGQLAEQLRPDIEKRASIYAKSGRWQTPNEVRALENMPPSDDPRADELTFDPGTPETDDPTDPDDLDPDDVL